MNKQLKKASEIIVDQVFCKGCLICIDQCPQKVIDVSVNRNSKGYIVPEIVRIDKCNGCKICELICPDLAITVNKGKNEK